MTKTMKTTACLAALLTGLAAPAMAAGTAVGLIGDRTLVMIDAETAQVTGMQAVQIEGRLLGIDYRAPNETLIGVTDGFAVVQIDPMSGEVTEIVQMDRELPIMEGAPVIVDINPVPDALRFMSGTVNHRVNLGTGAVMVDGDLHFDPEAGIEGAPDVVATGYSNNLGRPEGTMMFNLDLSRATLLRQTAPNDGTNVVIGALGIEVEGPLTFDIGTDAEGINTAWASTGMMLHRIDLETGMVTGSWEIEGLDSPLRDLTLMP